MSIREDREELETTGVQGLLRSIIAIADEGFVRVLPGGWRGEIVSARPVPGSGPFIHFRRGEPLYLHRNATIEDQAVEEYRLL